MTKEKKGRAHLHKYHYEAIEKRYLGYTFPEIAAYISQEYGRIFEEKRVARWFYSKGILFRAYIDYSLAENDRRRQQMRIELGKLTSQLPKKLQQLLDRRIRHPFSGQVMKDPLTGRELDKLDQVTLNTVKAILEVVYQIEAGSGGGSDPSDDYFDKAEDEIIAGHDDVLARVSGAKRDEVARPAALPIPDQNSSGDSPSTDSSPTG